MNLDRLSEIKMLIDIYLEIKNIEAEITIKEYGLKIFNEDYEVTKNKLEYNEASKIDVRYMEIEIKEIKNELDYLRKICQSKKKEVLEKVNLKYVANVFEEIGSIDIKIRSKEIEIQYYRKIDYPDINFNYDLENETWTAEIRLSGEVLEFKTDSRIREEELKKLKIEKKYLEKKNNWRLNILI